MKYKLSELVDINKKTISKEYSGSIKYIDTSSVNNGVFDKPRNYESIQEAPSRARRLASSGDILFSTVRPNMRHMGFIARDTKYVFSTGFAVISPKQNLVDPYYLYLFLSTNKIINLLQNIGETATSAYPSIKPGDIAELIIDLPPLESQKNISHRIKIIDRKIQNNRAINANLLKLAKEIYYHSLTLNETEETKLSDFATIVMGQSPSSKTYNEEQEGTALLNGATDFRNGIHPSKWTTDPKKIVSNGAYVFGVRATIGLTTKVFQQYAIGRGTGSAIPKNNIDDEFLYFVLNDMFNYFRQTGTGSVYINISKQNFNNYTFAKPSDQVLLKFHQRVKPIMDYVYLNTQENNNLIKVKNNLLNKLF